jgi:hypothetical protein
VLVVEGLVVEREEVRVRSVGRRRREGYILMGRAIRDY